MPLIAFCLLLFLPVAGIAETRVVRDNNSPHLLLFVHGLTGSIDRTFGAPPERSWMTLVRDDPLFDSFDIAAFGYDSGYVATGKSVAEIALDARRELDDSVAFQRYQKVHILAHSLGGIVARELVLGLRDDGRNTVRSLYLFGTPTNGSWLSNALARYSPSKVVQDLSVAMGDTDSYLSRLRNRWRASAADAVPLSRQVVTHCAYELHKTGPTVVVQPSSAEYLCTEAVRGLETDHSGLVDADAGNFVSHHVLREWLLADRPDLVKYRASPQTAGDVVIALCSDDRYSRTSDGQFTDRFHVFLQDLAERDGWRTRLSLQLPLDWPEGAGVVNNEARPDGYLGLLWQGDARPAAVVIHYSCFEAGTETTDAMHENRDDMDRFYRSIAAQGVDLLMFSSGVEPGEKISFHKSLLKGAGFSVTGTGVNGCAVRTRKYAMEPGHPFQDQFRAALQSVLADRPCPAFR